MQNKPKRGKQLGSNISLWLGRISDYEKEFKSWEGRSDKIIKRYKDDGRTESSSAKYNILWSNVQTLSAATFAKIPKPDVSRRFKDNDPVGRVAGMILERALDYEITKYSSYTSALKACVLDRFLGGRGTAWVRYEPHFKAMEQQQPQDGLEITEDVDEPEEQLDYECAPCDYVHWRDFGHTLARTWEEVPSVWRKVYLTREQCVERFGEEMGKKIPLDARPEDHKKREVGNTATDDSSRALIYEIWDKTTKKAHWLSKSLGEMVDEKDDPLGLEDFFPCPKPMFSTLSNDSLVPTPDFYLYQDQANELDILSGRIDGLIKSLKVMGVYNAGAGDLQRLFTEGENHTLIPVKDWSAFSEKNGLKGAMDILDLSNIVGALQAAYQAMEHVKQQVYDITGISDIVRGQTVASETATAQQIKGQFASLRLKTVQDDVARFATELLRIQSQIICGQFSPKTIISISAADQLSPQDQQLAQPALQMLIQKDPNPVRMFRIEVSADSLIQIDEQQEKQDRNEFMQAISTFMTNMAPIVANQKEMVPVVGELLKFGVRSFKVGKGLESAIDTALDSIGKQQGPQIPPEVQQQIDQGKQELQRLTQENQQLKSGAQVKMQQMQMDSQVKAQTDAASQQQELQKHSMQLQMDERIRSREMDFEKWKAELDAKVKIMVAEISAKTDLQTSQIAAASAGEASSEGQ